MKKIIIKGNFTLEGDGVYLNNIQQPLKIVELEIEEKQVAVRMVRLYSVEQYNKDKVSENHRKKNDE